MQRTADRATSEYAIVIFFPVIAFNDLIRCAMSFDSEAM